MPRANITYSIREVAEKPSNHGRWRRFEVAKFVEGETEPANVYDVEIQVPSGIAMCNCPAALYHGKQGDIDKHVKMVKDWIRAGMPTPCVIPAS